MTSTNKQKQKVNVFWHKIDSISIHDFNTPKNKLNIAATMPLFNCEGKLPNKDHDIFLCATFLRLLQNHCE